MSEITDKIDRFGHCVNCGNNLLTKRVVDGKVIDMFLPIYDETIFILDNGSQMQVTICRPCKDSIDLNDHNIHSQIMESVQKGWQLETKIKLEKNNPNWTIEKRDEYLDKMSKLNIDCNSDLMSRSAIQLKQFELIGIKFQDIGEFKILEVSNGIDN